MALTEEVLIRMGVDARPVTAALRGVRKDFAALKDGLRNMNPMSALQGISGKLLGAGIGAAVTMAVKKSIDFAEQVKDLSESLNVNVETLQAWQLQVARSGGTAEQAATGLEKLAVKIGEARTGNEQAADSFKRLGISLEDAEGKGKPTEAILYEIADRIKAIEDPTIRAQVAFDLFGKSGLKMVNALQEGSKGLEDFKRAASGKILSENEVAQLDKLSKIGSSMGKFATTAVGKGVALLSTAWLGDVAFNDWIKQVKKGSTPEANTNDFEAQAAKAKEAAKALADYEKARRENTMKHMTERMKLRLMEKEERQIRADLRDAEDDSIEQVRLKTELLEKQKEIADQAEKVQKQQRDWD